MREIKFSLPKTAEDAMKWINEEGIDEDTRNARKILMHGVLYGSKHPLRSRQS